MMDLDAAMLVRVVGLLLELILQFCGSVRTSVTCCRVLLDHLKVLEVRAGFERLVTDGKAALDDASLPRLITRVVTGLLLINLVVAPHEVV